MDRHVEEMSKAYKALADSIAAYLWAMQMSSGERTKFPNSALDNFKSQYEAFKAACDRAEVTIDTAKRRLATEYLDFAADLVEMPTAAGEPSDVNEAEDCHVEIEPMAAVELPGSAEDLVEVEKQLTEPDDARVADSAAETPDDHLKISTSDEAKPDYSEPNGDDQ